MADKNTPSSTEQKVEALLSTEVGKYAVPDFKSIRRILLRVIRGTEKESKLVRYRRWNEAGKGWEEGSEVLKFEIPHAVRVRAAQVYKEIVLNKMVPDKRMAAEVQSPKGAPNHAAAAKKISEKRKAAKTLAIKTGKVSELKKAANA